MKLIDKIPHWVSRPLVGASCLLLLTGIILGVTYVKDNYPLVGPVLLLIGIAYGICYGVGTFIDAIRKGDMGTW